MGPKELAELYELLVRMYPPGEMRPNVPVFELLYGDATRMSRARRSHRVRVAAYSTNRLDRAGWQRVIALGEEYPDEALVAHMQAMCRVPFDANVKLKEAAP